MRNGASFNDKFTEKHLVDWKIRRNFALAKRKMAG